MTTRAGNTICNFCNSLRGGDLAPSTSSSHLSPRDIFLTRSGKAIFDFARTFLSLSVKKYKPSRRNSILLLALGFRSPQLSSVETHR